MSQCVMVSNLIGSEYKLFNSMPMIEQGGDVSLSQDHQAMHEIFRVHSAHGYVAKINIP
jgi:hypothetical protein